MVAASVEECNAFASMLVAVELKRAIAHYQFDRAYFTLPATPHIRTLDVSHPGVWRSIAAAPYFTFQAADLAELREDAERLHLYCSMNEYTMLPPLRRAAEMYASKLHLAQMFNPKRLDKLLPGLGKSWAVKTGLNVLFAEHVIYAREWESLVARWRVGDTSILQPRMPRVNNCLLLVLNQMKERVSQREFELIGVSAGKGLKKAEESFYSGGGGGEQQPASEDT
jgi:hypothetical protein